MKNNIEYNKKVIEPIIIVIDVLIERLSESNKGVLEFGEKISSSIMELAQDHSQDPAFQKVMQSVIVNMQVIDKNNQFSENIAGGLKSIKETLTRLTKEEEGELDLQQVTEEVIENIKSSMFMSVFQNSFTDSIKKLDKS